DHRQAEVEPFADGVVAAVGDEEVALRQDRWLRQELVAVHARAEPHLVLERAHRDDDFLPQPSILPQCDLLITHGGNNTICEGFHFGLPMIGLPLFWDQYDNAQRLAETGFGARLATYDWTDDELAATVDRLLADKELKARLGAVAGALQRQPGSVKGADLIERLALTGEPVLR
ncbi:MAG TPA: nucleotide disphospho-sugar-binding domain-containing protein, partial [Thermoleophilia bacterium]|nr:nucleotide disphospho-sugar-binding domain-containing protein [Thermoleophilia bacterium]